MEKGTAKSENSSFPAMYQCIVCQMPTTSMSRLHRHQTYRHTSEELSLSTIALQCSLINNLNATNSIVYDNSWLCDPLKQAEFYTVSANLLNDCNKNPTNCNPVDYVVEKDADNFDVENNIEISDEQEIQDFDLKIDHNYGRMDNFSSESLKNEMQIQKFRISGTETNAKLLEEVSQPEASSGLCTETEHVTYLEEAIQMKEIIIFNTESNYDSAGSRKIIKAKEGKDMYEETAAKEMKVETDLKMIPSETYSISKSEAKKPKVKEFKVPDVNSILKSAAKNKKVIEFKVPKGHSVLKSAKKETEAEKSKVVCQKANCNFKSAEKEMKVEKSTFIDAEAKSVSEFAEKAPEVEELKILGPQPNCFIKSAKKATNVVKPETDTFVNCIESLCMDLERMKTKPQKRKRATPRNVAPKKPKAARKPRAPKKKAKTSDSVSENNTIEQEVNKQTELSVKNDSGSMDCIDRSSKIQKKKNSGGLSKKKTKVSYSLPANITIRQEFDKETQIPINIQAASTNCVEHNLNILNSQIFVEPPIKKAKMFNSTMKVENATIMQYANQETKVPPQNHFESIKYTEHNLESQKTEDYVDLPRKKAKASNSHPENTSIIQKAEKESEMITQNHSASINNNQLNLRSQQRTENSVKKKISGEDIVEAQLKTLFQQQTETQETEIPPIDDSANSQWIDYHVVKMEPAIHDEEHLAHDNFIQQYVDTCKAEVPAEIPVEMKSELQEFLGNEFNDLRNSEHSEDSVIAALPSTYTFPWYPPDINDYSILVLDPEVDQLVWTEVAIVDDKNKLESENLQDAVLLPELTEADLRNNEICEAMTLSSDPQPREVNENSLRSQIKGKATNTKKKPRTNFILRRRKAAEKKML